MKNQTVNPGSIVSETLDLQNLFSVRILILLILILIETGNLELKAQRLSRDLNVDLLVNQVGYVPNIGKNLVTKGIRNGIFEIINLETQKVVYSAVLKPDPGDFGEYSVGDFSTLHTGEQKYKTICHEGIID